MIKVTLRGILEHKVRFLLSVIAVILGVAFVAGTFSLRTMLSSTFESITASTMQGDLYVTQPISVSTNDVSEPRVPISFAQELADVAGIAAAIPGISGPLVLVGKDGTAVSSTQAPIMGIAAHKDDQSSKITAGRAPTIPAEIALEAETLKRSGLRIGDSTRIILSGQISEVTVVGEASFNGPLAGATIVFLDEATAVAAYAPDSMITSIELYLDETASADAVLATVTELLAANRLDASITAETGEQLRADANESISSMLGFIGSFLLVFVAISLFVGAFIISNTFAMTVAARARELALLRAIGASKAQIFGSVVGQSAVVGTVGSVLGVGVGLVLVYALRGVFESMGMALSDEVPLELNTVVISVLCGLVVSLGAAAIPARRAAATPPVEAMREGVAVSGKSSLARAICGLVLTAAGVALVVYAANQGSEDFLGAYGAGAGATLLGILIAAPSVAPAMTYCLAIPFAAAIRPMGRLAQGNVARNPKRTASTASALVIGMALVGAASVIAASVTSSVEVIVAEEAQADVILTVAGSQGVLPNGAIDAVTAVPEVARVDSLTWMEVEVDGERMPVTAIEPSALGTSFEPVLAAGQIELDDATVVLLEGFATEKGLTVGDSVTLGSGASQRVMTVAGIIGTQMISGALVMSADLMGDYSAPAARIPHTAMVTWADGVAAGDARQGVVDAVAPFVVVTVQDVGEFTSSLSEQVSQMLTILYALLGLSIIIAVLGIVNTLTLSVMERTREIGLLRAVGLGRLQLGVTITIESVLISIFGAVLGLMVGVGLGAALPSIMAETGLKTLTIPWEQLGVMLGLSALVGILAALWPAVRAARLPVLQAIATD